MCQVQPLVLEKHLSTKEKSLPIVQLLKGGDRQILHTHTHSCDIYAHTLLSDIYIVSDDVCVYIFQYNMEEIEQN